MKSVYNSDPDESKNPEKQQAIQKLIELKFLEQRKVFLWDRLMMNLQDVVSRLLYLETLKPGEKITLYINSPGGIITSGYSILDTMSLISSPVSTVCMGLAASMGSILLSAGHKGERYIYPLGR